MRTNLFKTIQRRKPLLKRRAKPRRKTVENTDREYLEWVRMLPCVVCYRDCYLPWIGGARWTPHDWRRINRRIEAAHVGARGLSQKCSDRETIPLCALHHREGPESHHKLGKRFWQHWEIDNAMLIRRLQEEYDART